ncbi:hypothetical protein Mp_4g02100 [Marchantia polymorpha subsp. ruderalis]|uniref:Uncharacterized protein n=2 Tax=Marchantia polymorpha TaxID=3197 RepID=A0AAF6B5E8_MARPO|nr:hypothetical protein MARPO_0080s0089 [Marchantia polymorpha]BBN07232.1 hypothetical protein Mp_4g02100 [Marchantia polymorpha subsp. ruderalis]|eukprot:PTQ34474.1 hypothetical protein MARPO_0080s0089 [Marchantia polymorpha]
MNLMSLVPSRVVQKSTVAAVTTGWMCQRPKSTCSGLSFCTLISMFLQKFSCRGPDNYRHEKVMAYRRSWNLW